MLKFIPKKYLLKNSRIYWHKLYFDLVPNWTCKYTPPLGNYNYAAYFIQPHKYAEDLYCRAKWFIQRGVRGYSDNDVWGWYSHHAKVMVGVLQSLRDSSHGYPMGQSPAKWNKKLKTMQEGFQAVVDEENDTTSYKTLSRKAHLRLIRERQRKLNLGLKYFREHYSNLWD